MITMKKSILRRLLIYMAVGSLFGSTYAAAQNIQTPKNPGNPAPQQGQQGPPPNQEIIPTTAAYTQNGETVTKTNQTITASKQNQSGIKVADGGTLTLMDSTVTTTGVTY